LLKLVEGWLKHRFRKVLVVVVAVFPILFVAASYVEDLLETANGGSDNIAALIAWIPAHLISLGASAGYRGVFFLTLLDSAGVPFPSEIVLPFAGYLVSQGTLQFWPVVSYATLAAVLGAAVDYCIGRKLGSPLATGQVKLPYVSARHVQRVQEWFDAYGSAAVALFRLVPGARVLISFPAGACRVNPVEFLFYTLLGCLSWDILLVYLGWWLGSSWATITSILRYLTFFTLFGAVAFVLWLVLTRRLRMGHRSGF
jgi:membrane protein DedA with SNARE-associated domain